MFAEVEDGDFVPIGNDAPIQTIQELEMGPAVTDASIIQSHASSGGAGLHWALEFGDVIETPIDSENAIIAQPSQHMDSEDATYILHDEFEMSWTTGLDVPLTDGFDFPLFAPEERPFATSNVFDGFPLPEEQY